MRGFALTSRLDRAHAGILGLVAVCALASGAPREAHAAVVPPADSTCAVFDWVDRSASPWQGRIRLMRYLTLGVAGGGGAHAGFALRVPDSTVIVGADSAWVVLQGTQVRWPGLPVLLPSVAATADFAAHGQAPPGGSWRGLSSGESISTTLPGEPVDICLFVRVAPGTSDAVVGAVVLASVFGSAVTSPTGVLQSNVAFEPAACLKRSDAGGGGSGLPRTHEP